MFWRTGCNQIWLKKGNLNMVLKLETNWKWTWIGYPVYDKQHEYPHLHCRRSAADEKKIRLFILASRRPPATQANPHPVQRIIPVSSIFLEFSHDVIKTLKSKLCIILIHFFSSHCDVWLLSYEAGWIFMLRNMATIEKAIKVKIISLVERFSSLNTSRR